MSEAIQLLWSDPEDLNERAKGNRVGKRGGGYAEIRRIPKKPKQEDEDTVPPAMPLDPDSVENGDGQNGVELEEPIDDRPDEQLFLPR